MNHLSKKTSVISFLILETILYYFVLTAGGQTLVATSYASIVLCFLFALQGIKRNPLMVAGLACTVGADFCLVVCDPIQRLWGMVFFLGAQTLYAIHLHLKQPNKIFLLTRIALTAAAGIVAAAVLKENVDALAVVSVCYYGNLILNAVAAFTQWRRCKLLPIAFVLFILCDTIIGLQVASMGYLPIAEGSALHDFLFMDFNLSWFFYLPSQVMIALSSLRKEQ